ncbi:MAG: toll/interleukin-1 receptor domain-containing protein [Gammaproteobacteria bacterium]|nr:toll/interleukin-1 receptor domain-containing protein [Gammaproteobacteria bacterium]
MLARLYDLFISHASKDKEAITRPLYEALKARGLSVWFDEAELTLGDSLRRKIDNGLARCRFGIVILSPRFLEKEWPQRELDGLVARETDSGQKALLPVWHDLDKQMLLRYSPALADRLAADTHNGLDTVVAQIERALSR